MFTMFLVLFLSFLVVLVSQVGHVSGEDYQSFHDQFQKVHQEIQSKHAKLQQQNEHQYLLKVSEESARFVFNFLDTDHNKKLDKNELIRFGKLTVSNETEGATTFADVALYADKDGDTMLTFEEFHQPEIHYGEQTGHHDDHKHQHKEGHGYEKDPKDHHKHDHREEL